MPFVPSYERLMREDAARESRQEGRKEGLQRGVLGVLKIRFGAAGAALGPRLAMADAVTLDAVLTAAESSAPLEEIERLLP